MSRSIAGLRLLAVPSFHVLPSRSGKKRLRVNQPRVTMRSSARGWVVPPGLLRDYRFQRIPRLVLGHFRLRTQHADALLLPLRLSSCGVEHLNVHVPNPRMVFEADCASLMRSRHSFLTSESVAGCEHYIVRELQLLRCSICSMNFSISLAR